MAIKHKAFTFHPAHFFRELENVVIVNSKPIMERLYTISKEVVITPSVTMSRALTFLRYDEEWYSNFYTENDIHRSSNWFLVFLASMLKAAPDLSSSQPFSYTILEKILTQIGWDKESVDLLIVGNRLETLLEFSNYSLFRSLFSFDQYRAGWLSEEEVNKLYYKLIMSQGTLCEPPAVLFDGAIVDLAKRFYLTPDEVIRKSFAEAMAMLLAAIERKSALFLVID
jgi:hypothetical protein